MASQFCLKRRQIIRRKTDVDELFGKGKIVVTYPIKCVVIEVDKSENPKQLDKAIFLVPKKIVKKAVYRNLMRRKIKESYRINRIEGFHCALIYIGNEICSYNKIDNAIITIFKKISDSTSDSAR